MTSSDLRKAMHAKPFRPFTLGLEDGQRLIVPDPIHVAISDPGNYAVVTHPADDRIKIVPFASSTRLVVAPLPL